MAEPRPRYGSLLANDVLVVQQASDWFSTGFDIQDEDGNVVGGVTSTDSGVMKFLGSDRNFVLHETTGAPVAHLSDPMNWGRDRYEIADATGEPLAELVQEWGFFRSSLSLSVADGTLFSLTGEVFGFNYTVDGPDGQAAQISREWAGLAMSLLRQDRYVVAFSPRTPPVHRAAILSCAIALDMQADERRRRRSDD